MTENEGGRSFIRKAINVGVAAGLAVGGIFGGANKAEAHSSQTVDNKPASTAPLGSAEVQEGDDSVSPVVEKVTTNAEKEPCEAGCELQEILSKDKILLEGPGSLPDLVIDRGKKPFGRTLGDVYPNPDGDIIITSMKPVAGKPISVDLSAGSVAGYYQAPDGLWYKIGTTEPKTEEE